MFLWYYKNMRYNIIFLEGVGKIGKSSQLVLLKQEFSKTKKTIQLNFDKSFSPEELNLKINELRDWCSGNPDGVALVSGSVAYSIVYRDLSRSQYGVSYSEFEIPIKNFFNLLRDFKVINILLKSNNYEYLQNRTYPKNSLNLENHIQINDGFLFFENSQITYDFKWEKINISQYDSILNVDEKIKKILE